MIVEADPRRVFEIVQEWKSQGFSVGFVPTMGYLHEGHLTLLRIARQHADKLVVSIFVNPTQFDRKDDLDNYPKDLQRDLDLCKAEGCNMVFVPTPDSMYPKGYSTYVNVERLTDTLCGATRPGHFRGVATVVTKLFNIVAPDISVFGEKDYQQLKIIERMVADLNLPVRIIAGPTVREPDGLAMSSRNARLSADERKRAVALFEALNASKRAVESGEREVDNIKRIARDVIERANPTKIDYIEIVDADDLQPLDVLSDRPAQMAVAVFFGEVRLIDNMRIFDP